MNLTYRILCIDDQPNNIKGQLESIETAITQNHLKHQIDVHSSFTKQGQKQLYDKIKSNNDYDLILIDYDLGSGSGGEKIAKKIRGMCHNEIIFYSSANKEILLQALCDERTDGVFTAKRSSLGRQVRSIISVILKRYERLNPLRGMYMAEVSSFDNKLKSILSNYSDGDDPEKVKLVKSKISSILQSQIRSANKFIEKLDEKSIDDVLSSPLTTLNIKYGIVRELIKELSAVDVLPIKEKLLAFEAEIVHKRNSLAHIVEVAEGDSIVLEDRNGNKITGQDFKNMRKNLLEHHDNLNDIEELVDDGLEQYH